MDFKFVDKKYRAVPFWSWNDRLGVEETKRQVGVMDDAGIGGFMMHARGGLLTEYMGEEWFDNISAAIDAAHARGMHPWAYDENGWPSGFGDGKVLELGIDYHQKTLNIAPASESVPNVLLERDGYKFYFSVNPYYVDVMDERVVAKFIEFVYEKYAERFGGSFEGFFTDEPQLMNNRAGFPWSFTLPGKFLERYGYDIVESLDALFLPKENSKRVRRDFWQLVTELFSSSFFKQIGEWCTSHGYGFTGHLMMEDSLLSSIRASGSSMPHYEYFTHPGMDWLGRRTNEDLTARQLGSAAAQFGKKQVLSETFALSGHNVSLRELRGIYEQQMVKGVNLLCTHLEGYTNKGKRKRDYPPALYFQQPWWDDARLFFDAMSRIGMILAEGEEIADTLLIHSQTAAWELYDGDPKSKSSDKVAEINRKMLDDMRELENKHILYHLGDETVMARHASVEDGKLRVGKMTYSTVILPKHVPTLPSTNALLNEFRLAGGRVVHSAGEVEANPITDVNKLTYAMRRYPDFDVHYFVNTSPDAVTLKTEVGNLILDIETGEVHDFSGEIDIAQYESALLIDTHEKRKPKKPLKCPPVLNLSGEWQVKDASYNSITLDRCDWRVDGGEWQRNIYVLDILPRLNLLRRAAVLEQRYIFTARELSESMFLVTEAPEMFEISVNGMPILVKDVGAFRDTSFRMVPIREYLKAGENEIFLRSTVKQSEKCYNHIDKSWTCETMRNTLAFDTEIEQIYIAGDFGVELADDPMELERDAYRVRQTPIVTKMPTKVDINHLDLSGYPMFTGRLTLTRVLELDDPAAQVKLSGRGISSVRVTVNGKKAGVKIWSPYELDISEHLVRGKNVIELEIANNLRNMQGPFHLKVGESYSVSPGSFYREYNIVTADGRPESCHDVLDWWDDDICLVHFGLDK